MSEEDRPLRLTPFSPTLSGPPSVTCGPLQCELRSPRPMCHLHEPTLRLVGRNKHYCTFSICCVLCACRMRADVIFRRTVNLLLQGWRNKGSENRSILAKAIWIQTAWPLELILPGRIAQCLPGRWPEVLLGIWGGHISKDILCPYFHSWLGLKMVLHRQLSVCLSCSVPLPPSRSCPSSLPQQFHCCLPLLVPGLVPPLHPKASHTSQALHFPRLQRKSKTTPSPEDPGLHFNSATYQPVTV